MKKWLSILLMLAALVLLGVSPAFAESIAAQVIDANGNVTAYTDISQAWRDAKSRQATFKLFTDWTSPDAFTIPEGKSLTIDLNGHKLARDLDGRESRGSVIILEEGAALTINDSSENQSGTIEGGNNKYGGGIWADDSNTVTMNGGTIRRCKAYYGGGVYLDSGSKFYLNGGRIQYNTATYGGGVYAEDDSVFEANGGGIEDNEASDDGGGLYLWSAKTVLRNCTVARNDAKRGGGIFSDYNVFKDYSFVELVSTKLFSNNAREYGGIYHCAGSLRLFDDTRIMQNSCTNSSSCGGVYSKKSCIRVSGNVQVFGNFAGPDVSDVCFGESQNGAFAVLDPIGSRAMIGVDTKNGEAQKHWFYDYHSNYSSACPDIETYAQNFMNALFSNQGYTFRYREQTKVSSEGSSDYYYHELTVDSNTSSYDQGRHVTASKVMYKNVVLSPSEYGSSYNHERRTLVLNLPDYVKDLSRLSVWATVTPTNGDAYTAVFSAGSDTADGIYLDICNGSPTPEYTVRVEGGTVDGNKTEAKKRYLEPVQLQPTVPEGKLFLCWEVVEGDADSIPGFNAYAAMPEKLEMPKRDLTFRAVYKTAVSRVDVTVGSLPQAGQPRGSATATISYTVDGETRTSPYEFNWNGSSSLFQYNAYYGATIWLSSGPDDDFRFDDWEAMELYVNGRKLTDSELTHAFWYGDEKRTLRIEFGFSTEKASVQEVTEQVVEVAPDTTAEELQLYLPLTAEIKYPGIEFLRDEKGNLLKENNAKLVTKTATAPVTWEAVPEAVYDGLTLTGTATIPDKLMLADTQKEARLTVKIVSDKPQLAQLTADVKDGDVLIPTDRVHLFAVDGATIWYQVADGAVTQYDPEQGICLQNAGENTITAFCTKDGYLQSRPLRLTVRLTTAQDLPVTIVTKNGEPYDYVSGAGDYDPKDEVIISADKDPEKTVARWNAEGVTLTEAQKNAPTFTFTMPSNPVTITVEDYRYYVKELYLSSLTPIVGSHLPQAPTIVSAKDCNGDPLETPPLKITVWQWYIGTPADGTLIDEEQWDSYVVEDGKTYTAILSIEPTTGGNQETCDGFTVYVDENRYQPQPLLGSTSYLVDWSFTAIKDVVTDVALGDSMVAYAGNTIIFPDTVGIRTEHGTVDSVHATWSGTEAVDMSKPGSYTVTAQLDIPDTITATQEQKTRTVTVSVRRLIDRIALEPVGGSLPTDAGESLPTALAVSGTTTGVHIVDGSFSITPSGGTAVANTEYTLSVSVAPDAYYDIAANMLFTIGGRPVTAMLMQDGYYLSYSFTAREAKFYDVYVNGKLLGQYQAGKPVTISASETAFDGWTAEVVYPADDAGTGTLERKDIGLSFDDAERASTSFLMPTLIDGGHLELTANYNGTTAYDAETRTATITAAQAHENVRVIFAAYSGDGRLLATELVSAALQKGSGNTVTAKSLAAQDAAQVKIIVLDAKTNHPLFAAYQTDG